MTDLLTFYRWNRRHAAGRTYPRKPGPNPAAEALTAARADMEKLKAAKAHYETCAALKDSDPSPENVAAYQAALKAVTAARRYLPGAPCVSWQKDGRRGERLAFVEKPESFGLRFVGRVTPESYGGRDTWDTRESTGWLTDPYGDTFRDGTGLCYGVVYQLPARKGRARFVAGYVMGGSDDGGATLDLGNVFESASAENCSYEGARGHDDARDAARAADSMAQAAAEREREYQTAWALGRVYADAGETIEAARRDALELLAERRKARALGDGFPAICATIRGQVRAALATIADARETRRKALQGDGGDSLSVYMGDDEKAAFCDAAGLQAFPV